jgi:GGDEF domain-containing protein
VACYPEGGLTKEGLFAAADRALYEAKSAGRNCVRSAGAKPTGVAR